MNKKLTTVLLSTVIVITLLLGTSCQIGGTPAAAGTLEPHQIIETAVAGTLATEKGDTAPPTATVDIDSIVAMTVNAAHTPTPTWTPDPTKTVAPTVTLTARPTATIVAKNDAQVVYDTVVTGCEAGAPSVTIGPVTINCDQDVIPAPVSFTSAPAGFHTGNVNMNGRCMTNADLVTAHGWNASGVKPVKDGENVPWEGCGKWQMQATGVGVYWQPFLDGFEYTVTQANGIVSVNKGPGGMYVWGATIRQLDTYTSANQAWVLNDVTLMAREYNYGFKQTPKYGTVPGVNLQLNGQWTQPDINITCPTNTVMAAAILGGDEPSYWTPPDWTGGAWVFNSKGHGFHHLNHPGGSGWFDVWTATQGAVKVFASDTHLLETLNFEEASFTCD